MQNLVTVYWVGAHREACGVNWGQCELQLPNLKIPDLFNTDPEVKILEERQISWQPHHLSQKHISK